MKHRRRLSIWFLIVPALCITVFAHPGKTDGNGGHTDHSTGEYHYHHGYPAHQHTGGSCPYDFDDKTGENSGSTSSTNPDSNENNNHQNKPSTNSEEAPTAVLDEDSPTRTKEEQEETFIARALEIIGDVFKWIFLGFAALYLLGMCVYFVCYAIFCIIEFVKNLFK